MWYRFTLILDIPALYDIKLLRHAGNIHYCSKCDFDSNLPRTLSCQQTKETDSHCFYIQTWLKLYQTQTRQKTTSIDNPITLRFRKQSSWISFTEFDWLIFAVAILPRYFGPRYHKEKTYFITVECLTSQPTHILQKRYIQRGIKLSSIVDDFFSLSKIPGSNWTKSLCSLDGWGNKTFAMILFYLAHAIIVQWIHFSSNIKSEMNFCTGLLRSLILLRVLESLETQFRG